MSFQANIRYLICFGFGRWYRQLKGCIFTVWGRCYEDVGSLLWGCGDRYYNCLDIVGYGQCTDLKSPTGIRLNIMHSLPHIRWYIAKFKQDLCWLGPYHVEYTPSRLIWEVKQRRAWLVLAWVTGWEYHVFKPSFCLPHSPCKHKIRLTSHFPCLLRNTLPEQGQKN